MAAYNWGDALQMATVFAFFLAVIVFFASVASIDYPPYEARTNKLVSDPAAVAACETAAAAGDKGCIKHFYIHRAWGNDFEWWVYHFTEIVILIELFFIVLYLRWQKYGIFWFLMLFVLTLGFIWLAIVIIMTSVYWSKCEDHSACSNALFTYDFTETVEVHVATAWVFMNVALYVILFLHLLLVLFSLLTQACLSRAVGGRETGLNALFTRKDGERVNEENLIRDGIDSALEAGGGGAAATAVKADWLARIPETTKEHVY